MQLYQRHLTVISSAHCKSSKKRINGVDLQAIAPMSLQNIYLSLWLNPIAFTLELGASATTPPSVIHFCKFGRSSKSTLLFTGPIAFWMRHFISIFPVLLSRILPKKASRADAKRVSGRADLSNFPSTKQPPTATSGFLTWLTRDDFLHDEMMDVRWVMNLNFTIC